MLWPIWGFRYYYNSVTSETSWKRPPPLADAAVSAKHSSPPETNCYDDNVYAVVPDGDENVYAVLDDDPNYAPVAPPRPGAGAGYDAVAMMSNTNYESCEAPVSETVRYDLASAANDSYGYEPLPSNNRLGGGNGTTYDEAAGNDAAMYQMPDAADDGGHPAADAQMYSVVGPPDTPTDRLYEYAELADYQGATD